MCEELEVPYRLVKTDIYDIVFNIRKETNPCSLCAKMRKGALNQAIKEMGCNKSAYGHHKDDVVETLMLSLVYEGRINTFRPVTFLDRTGITLIRPLIYIEESDIIGFSNKYDLPVMGKKCPVDGNTKREYIKELIKGINVENPGVADRMFTAVQSSGINGWDERIIRARGDN